MKLINADKLFSERPEYRNPIHEKNSDFNKGWNACVDTFCDIIKDQPTAYDVEKVVAEIQESKMRSTIFLSYAATCFAKSWNQALNVAIDIVKKGGV